MSDPALRPSPLPLLDLLEALQEAGLPIGVREHLTVGRLVSRWDTLDVAMLRAGLAALLARNPAESALVKETFDRVYAQPAAATTETAPAPRPDFVARLKTRWVAWGAVSVLAAGVLAYALVSMRPRGPVLPPSPPAALPSDAPSPPAALIQSDVVTRRVNWWRAGALAGAAGAVLFIVLYGRRTRKDARRHAMRVWSEELERRPGPLAYELVSPLARPPYPPGLLDDVGVILGRHASPAERGDELDVDRSVAATLRAGMAPQIVWRVRVASLPILVLEDVAEEMRPWRDRVDALLRGLAVRGVALDHWRFDADGGRLFRGPEGPGTMLRQLARRSADNPLLVISTGAGVLEGDPLQRAGWVDLLRHWRSRAWLHPVADRRYWRRELRRVAVEMWPMTFDGVLAAARQLSRGESRMGERAEARAPAERPVSPLDVERLQWLISLAPRRDPMLAELLRRRFCPHVPPAALLEALASPPSTVPPPVGPDAEEVHRFLAEVLADSRPLEEGTAAFDRWRLDQALQLMGAGQRDRALGELSALAQGAAAPMVVDAVERLAPLTPALRAAVAPEIGRQVMRPLEVRASQAGWVQAARSGARRWTRPRPVELGAAVVCAAALLGASPKLGPVTRDVRVHANEVYELSSSELGGFVGNPWSPRPFVLTLRRRAGVPDDASIAPRTARVFQDGSARAPLASDGGPGLSLAVEDRGHWFQAQAALPDRTLAVSNLVWVAREGSSGWLQVEVLDEKDASLRGVAQVEVSDGRSRLVTSAGARTPLPMGHEWTVRVTAEGYAPQERRILVNGGSRDKPVREVIRLARLTSPTPAAPRPGLLYVTYAFTAQGQPVRTPYGAAPVGGGSARSGTTGQDLELPPGRWRVTLSRPLGTIERTVDVREGRRTILNLAPLPTPTPTTLPEANAPPASESPLTAAPNAAPNAAQQGPPIETRESPRVSAVVGCEEERVVQVVYTLRSGEQYVDATVAVASASNLKEQTVLGAQYDAKSRTVVGRVRIRGLDRVLLNCPGGGNATIGMRVRVRSRGAQAY